MGFSKLNLLCQRELVCMLITAAISLITRKSALFHNQLLIAFKMSQRWNTCNLAITVSKLMASTRAFHSNESDTSLFWSFIFFRPFGLFIWNALGAFRKYPPSRSAWLFGECAHLRLLFQKESQLNLKEPPQKFIFPSSPGVPAHINDRDDVSITERRALQRAKPAKQTYLIFHWAGPSGAISQYSPSPFPDAFSRLASFQTLAFTFFQKKPRFCRDLHERRELLKC